MSNRFNLLAATLAVLSFAVTETGHADIWQKDPSSGCEVWSWNDESAKEIISWSGSCEDGKAIGTGSLVVMDKDGLALVFRGEMKAGKVDGWATL